MVNVVLLELGFYQQILISGLTSMANHAALLKIGLTIDFVITSRYV